MVLRRVGLIVLVASAGGCGSSAPRPDGGAADATIDRGADASDASDASAVPDASDDGGLCTGPGDGAPTTGCELGGCPAGTTCLIQIGGVAGPGGSYCVRVPDSCHGTPTCACMAAACACTTSVVGPEQCTDADGGLSCFDGII